MSDNPQLLRWLLDTNRIRVRRGPLFDLAPDPMPEGFDFDRVEGMMLGLAIGDALGNSSEGMTPRQRRTLWGEVRDYLPHLATGDARGYLPHPATGDARGYPSDDTQLAFWTLEQMIADRGFDPNRVAVRFCADRIYGIGSTVKEFLRNYRQLRKPWYECGPESAGNGALMRIAPMVIPHLRSGTTDLWVDTALSAMITHNDSASISACLAFVRMLWQLLAMESPPSPEWWLDAYVDVARDLESHGDYRPRAGAFAAYQGPLWRFALDRVGEARRQRLSALEACDEWYSGAYLLETVPSVLYILMRHGHDPEEAIDRAVNDTVDNDTVAAIVGAAVGALHGKAKLPERWVSGLSGRTGAEDEGRVFELLAEAKSFWWP